MLQLKPGVKFPLDNAPRNSKIVILSAGVGIVLVGVLTRYLRKRYWEVPRAAVNGDVRKSFCVRCRRTSSRLPAILGPEGKSELTPDQVAQLGLDSLEQAVCCWEEAMHLLRNNNISKVSSLDMAALEELVRDGQHLGGRCRSMLLGEEGKPPPSAVETDSFVSAEGASDVAVLSDLEPERIALYTATLELLERDSIPCRNFRLEMLRCSSENDYLVKIHCVRLAFQHLCSQEGILEWLIGAGSQILGGFMACGGKDPKEALVAYKDLVVFLLQPSNREQIEKELLSRGIVCVTVYDVFIDYILLDAFEDLSNPPQSVVAVIQNRWLTTGFKETALSAAIWSVLKAKKSMLPYSEGFFSHYYSLMEHVTPVLAWGFLGSDGELKRLCYFFKAEVESLVVDMFDLSRTRYTTVEEIAEDIFNNTQVRYDKICQALLAAVDTPCSSFLSTPDSIIDSPTIACGSEITACLFGGGLTGTQGVLSNISPMESSKGDAVTKENFSTFRDSS